MRRFLAFGLSLAVLVVAGSTQTHHGLAVTNVSHADRHSSMTPREMQLAIKAAKHAAVQGYTGDAWPPNVKLVEAVVSTRDVGVKLMNAEIPSDTSRVIVIRMSGRFTWNHSGPPGASTVATADAVIVIMKTRSGEIWDSSIGPHEPELGSLGPVVVLYRRS
jgi:hypothetical protein